jgi:4-aminobutyrate aminotransferase
MTIVDDETITAAWLERDRTALASVLSRASDVVATSGEGSWLVDVEGRRFLDFACGIAVTNIGHCHPRVVEATEAQVRRLIHTSIVTHNERNVELAERLRGLVPELVDAQVFFCNTGAETIDGAIKLARRATGRPGIVAFRGGFHGRTIGATSVTTAKAKYRAGVEPLMSGVSIAPYAYPLRYGGDDAATIGALAALDEIFAQQTAPDTVAAMIVEPVLGEGGYVVPPKAWLEGLRERCDRYGILLVFDEVQSGVGRTGSPFAFQTFGVRPDVVLFAKGIASGFPLGGLIAPRHIMELWPTATHGSTFGGNLVSCAAALATLDVLDDDDLYLRCRVLGARVVDRLRDASQACSRVLEVRGVGLMVGIEFTTAAIAAAVQAACLDEGLIVLTCGPAENVVRLMPALTISDDDLTAGLDILVRALSAHA